MFHTTSFNTLQRYELFVLSASLSARLCVIFILFAVRMLLRRVRLACVRSVSIHIKPCEIKGFIC